MAVPSSNYLNPTIHVHVQASRGGGSSTSQIPEQPFFALPSPGRRARLRAPRISIWPLQIEHTHT